ncbi:hypothetical protein [Sphingobacterium multivorum]|uniref:hypothetical protein n=1 Tax=Sphingobacterium multivorum TaxID=28454 RepID=UPI003DA3C6EC
MLIRFRPAPDQELPGQGLVNIYCKIVAFRSWYEAGTDTIRGKPHCIRPADTKTDGL